MQTKYYRLLIISNLNMKSICHYYYKPCNTRSEVFHILIEQSTRGTNRSDTIYIQAINNSQ